MTFTNPVLTLTFLGNDISGTATQAISDSYIVNYSIKPRYQLLNGLKSSSDTLTLQLTRNCPSIEDMIVTEGDVEAVLTDNGTTIFTGYLSTSYTWSVTNNGEQVLDITLESVGTRLLTLPYIETGRIFFDDTASSVIYSVCSKVGITIAAGHDRVLLQSVSSVVEAGTTCKQILDQLFYECNAVYWFNNLGQLCVHQINPDTSTYTLVDGSSLYAVKGKAISLTKKIRSYKGARIQYWALGTAKNYLVYRNTTNQSGSNPYCNLPLESGEYFDGAEIYSQADWTTLSSDTFRNPTLIGAVNAESESEIVGSNSIVNISNLSPNVEGSSADMSATFNNVGGGYFELVAHNSGGSAGYFSRLDLYADIVYQKSIGVVRTQINGVSSNKNTIEEEMEWIHDKTNAQKHANMVCQYHRYAGASYSFHTKQILALGSVVRLNDSVHSGLDVYVLVTNCTKYSDTDVIDYTAVGVSTFNLTDDVYYGTTEDAKSSFEGKQGAAGDSVEIQYALGNDPDNPPTSEMMWGNADMEWNSELMEWTSAVYTDTIPTLISGYYIWMRQRVGSAAWQYTRITGEEGESAKIWDFTMDYETYVRDMRNSGNNHAITLKKRIQGYSSTGTWTLDHGVIVPYDSTTGHLTIPYQNNYDTVTVTLYDTGLNLSISKTLSVVDQTYESNGMYLGELSALPLTPTEGDTFISGDYFIAATTFTGTDSNQYDIGVPYYYDGSGWYNTLDLSDSTNVEKAMKCLGGVMKTGIAVPSSAALWGWFQNLVAQNAVIQNLNATDALFENIHVSGKSQFDGNINSDAIETYDASSGSTISIVSPSGSYLLPRATVASELGSYGTYYADDGSVTIKNLTSNTSSTYTATSSIPFQITFTGNSFAIKRTSDGVFLIRTLSYHEGQGYSIRTNDYDTAEITACSLVLVNEDAGAMVSNLKPMDSTKKIGSSTEPFASGWFGSFVTTVAGHGSTNPEGHCTLTNGLELKWGNIPSSENSGKTDAFHTYPDEQGGPFSNSTIHVIINQPQYCRFEWDPTPPADPLCPAENGFRYVKYALASTSWYSSGNSARYLAIGY